MLTLVTQLGPARPAPAGKSNPCAEPVRVRHLLDKLRLGSSRVPSIPVGGLAFSRRYVVTSEEAVALHRQLQDREAVANTKDEFVSLTHQYIHIFYALTADWSEDLRNDVRRALSDGIGPIPAWEKAADNWLYGCIADPFCTGSEVLIADDGTITRLDEPSTSH